MYTSASLAMCYGADIRKAMTAGLLHDCGKYLSADDQISFCKKKKIPLTESELEMPALVHAKLGAYLAKHEYEIEDSDILDAITYHTTGRPDMTLLEKMCILPIILSQTVKRFPALLRSENRFLPTLTEQYVLSAGSTVRYLKNGGKAVDPMTINTYNFYKKKED